METATITKTTASVYRVLIVDDETAICEILAEVLRSPTRSIETCDTARGALEFLQHNPVDLAFVDVNLPGMSGLELTQRIKELNPQAHIIICTGYVGPELEEQAEAVRADRVLEKPLNFGEVLQLADSYASE